jgi:hypothetical protein
MNNEQQKSLEKLIEETLTPLTVTSQQNNIPTESTIVYELRQEDLFDLLHEGLQREEMLQLELQREGNENTLTNEIISAPLEHQETNLINADQKKEYNIKDNNTKSTGDKKLVFGGKPQRRTRCGPEDEFQTHFTFK